jgi:hypothetical protein
MANRIFSLRSAFFSKNVGLERENWSAARSFPEEDPSFNLLS